MPEELTLYHLLDEIKKLAKQIEMMSVSKENPSRSSDLKDLFAALAKAQAEMKVAGRNSENPYFKSSYASLADIVKASRPFLTKNGLSVIQQVMPNDNGQNILHTILAHASGQWIETRMNIAPAKNDIQSIASYITYLRRYSYAAICGVVDDEDDDGEQSMATERETFAKGTALNTKYNPREQSYESISADQLTEFEYELAEYPDIAEQILDGLKIQSLANIPKSKYAAAIRRVREIKRVRNGK